MGSVYRTPMTTAETRATRVGFAVVVLSIAASTAIVVASSEIPSPAHETRFVGVDGRVERGRVYCHGMIVIDGDVVWSMSEREGPRSSHYISRFDPTTGTSTLFGPIDTDASSLTGGVVGPSRERVFVVGDRLFEIRENTIRALDFVGFAIGLARVGEGIELVGRGGSNGLEISRFENGRSVSRRPMPLGVVPSEGRAVEPIAAFFEDGLWRVLVQAHSSSNATVPLDVTIHEQDEAGVARVLGGVRLDESVVRSGQDGTVAYVPPWLVAGTLVRGSVVVHSLHVYDGTRFEDVRFAGAPFVDVVATVLGDGPHARPMIADLGERYLWFGGGSPRLERVRVRDRFDALRVGHRTGPRMVASFWMDGGFRVVPRRDGGYVLIGALGKSFVRVGPDLRRTDALSIPARLVRLFVEDRAKYNSDFFHGAGALRAVTVPFMLAGPFVALVVFGLRRRRPGLASAIGATFIGGALLCTWHFAYVLRYFW